MNKEEAIKKIDDMTNILAVSIPDEVEIEGKVYRIKDDILNGDRDEMISKYQGLYQRIREKIMLMNDVPEDLVYDALILRRAVIFLREYRVSDDIEDKKRWLEYLKRVRQ